MKKLVLRGGNVVDVNKGSIYKKDVVLSNGLIEDILDNATDTENVLVVETSGYIAPGFINCHAHLGWDGIHDLQEQSQKDSDAISAFKYAANMQKSLKAGVTSVRDLGMNYSNIHAREAVNKKIIKSPRLYISGQAIMATGGHTWWCGLEVDGPWEVRKAIRKQAKLGATVIKIMASGKYPEFTMDELYAAVDEAHCQGLKIAAHATIGEAVKRVVEAGVDSVEHGGAMDDETIERMAEKGTYLIPTLSAVFVQARKGEEFGLPEAFVQRRKKQLAEKTVWNSIARASQMGVKFAYGSDAGSPLVPHDLILSELEALLEIGAAKDNLHLLQMMTMNAGDLIGDSRLGMIEKGYYADLVVLKDNPLEKINTIEHPMMVISNGEIV